MRLGRQTRSKLQPLENRIGRDPVVPIHTVEPLTSQFMTLILILPLVALCCWVYAECRLALGQRLLTGIACIVFTGYACHITTKIIPRYESSLHRSSLRLAGELTLKGETQRVNQAVRAYNDIAATGTTYRASMEMWHVLNHGPRH